ncbi:hypothetical protein F3J20_30235 [Paraburkholderia sp. Cy-641]|uniref:hypothetical protein n=1 Tax=Paraburkholderia sp. Cy-641 TaxID=2608337 RepID=UPI00141DE9EC|nr:hypothetical protein [Paraburkholderia sp. Cy-641]NIF81600.1 hypothetical protein [Paraburkholderia sp. Cy-641]
MKNSAPEALFFYGFHFELERRISLRPVDFRQYIFDMLRAPEGYEADARRLGRVDAVQLGHVRGILEWQQRREFTAICGSPIQKQVADNRQPRRSNLRRVTRRSTATYGPIRPRSIFGGFCRLSLTVVHDVARCSHSRHGVFLRLPAGIAACAVVSGIHSFVIRDSTP